jgi:uncharacterized protein
VLRVARRSGDEDARTRWSPQCERRIAARFGIADQKPPGRRWLPTCVRWTWRVKLLLHSRLELIGAARARRGGGDPRVRAQPADLLLAAPAAARHHGPRPGPAHRREGGGGRRTGKLLDTATVYPHEPRRDWDGSLATLAALAKKHGVRWSRSATAPPRARPTSWRRADQAPSRSSADQGDGVGGRRVGVLGLRARRQGVPELDVSLRGAVSIARRLQDPLAELVKIDPKSIGVGQYQHDVNQGSWRAASTPWSRTA